MKTLKELREKSVSQQQQKLMGLALAYKRGEVGDDEVSDEVKKIADTMSTKDLEDFAKTKHKGLPKKVDEYGGPPISRKDYLKQKPMQENVEDEMPASPDEKSMALKQAEFIQYVGREIGEHLVANKEFPEWMQNKLSALHQKAKDMHATLGAHGGEEDELDESFKLKQGDTFEHGIVVNGVKVTLARRGKGMSAPVVVYIDGKEWKIFQTRKMALKMGKEYAQSKGDMKESVELDESVTAKIYDAAMFLKRLLGFESAYERRLRDKRAGAKNLKNSDIEGFVKDAEPFLNFIQDGKARYYKSMLNKLERIGKANIDRLEGEDKMFAAMDAVDHMIQIRNYISRNKPSVNKESVELDESVKKVDNLSQLPKGVEKPLVSMDKVRKEVKMRGMEITHISHNKSGKVIGVSAKADNGTVFTYVNNKGVNESVELDENFRTLARHGMGTEPKDSRTKVGLGIDYYDKDGNKRSGKIVKTDAKGYTVKDDRDGKTHSFSFHDRTKAKELLAKHGKGQYNESMTFDKIRNKTK